MSTATKGQRPSQFKIKTNVTNSVHLTPQPILLAIMIHQENNTLLDLLEVLESTGLTRLTRSSFIFL